MNQTSTESGEAIRSAYARDGYYVTQGVLSRDECDVLKAEAVRVMRTHGRADASVYVGVAVVSDAYRALARDPRLLEPMKALMPDGVMFLSDKIVLKTSDKSFASPWHIDAAYWPGTRPKLSTWIPLDDASAANGTLVVVRGSHQREWGHERSNGGGTNGEFVNSIREAQWPAADEVVCEIPRGSVVFFNDRLVHGSRTNTAGTDRYTIIGTYQSPEPTEAFDLKFPARTVLVAPPARG